IILVFNQGILALFQSFLSSVLPKPLFHPLIYFRRIDLVVAPLALVSHQGLINHSILGHIEGGKLNYLPRFSLHVAGYVLKEGLGLSFDCPIGNQVIVNFYGHPIFILLIVFDAKKEENGQSYLNSVSISLTQGIFGGRLKKSNRIRLMRNPSKETWESFSEFLSSKGLRMTDQRKGVIEALFRQSGHFTAEQLLRDAQDLDETVSRATLYRSLPLLVESGIIRKVDVGQDNKF
ncbi:uncharacterized protein METZ01_LOCUS502145, partial [marine metagenome]